MGCGFRETSNTVTFSMGTEWHLVALQSLRFLRTELIWGTVYIMFTFSTIPRQYLAVLEYSGKYISVKSMLKAHWLSNNIDVIRNNFHKKNQPHILIFIYIYHL